MREWWVWEGSMLMLIQGDEEWGGCFDCATEGRIGKLWR